MEALFLVIYIYIYILVYQMYDKTHHQIVHHYPYFNLFMLHSNSIDNQEIQVNKNKTFFFCFNILSFTKTFQCSSEFDCLITGELKQIKVFFLNKPYILVLLVWSSVALNYVLKLK